MSNKYDYDCILEQNEVLYGDTSHAKICRRIQPNSKVMECGPATGIMTRYMKETLNCSVYILEYDQEAFDKARKWADGGVCADLEDDAWMADIEDATFDYILFSDVLEHLRDPEKVLKKVRRFLKADGSVIISVPNVAHSDVIANLLLDNFSYTSVGLLDNTHIHLFARQSLHEMIRNAGYYLAEEDATWCGLFESEQGALIPEAEKTVLEKMLSDFGSQVYQYVCELTLNRVSTRSYLPTKGCPLQTLHHCFFRMDYDDGDVRESLCNVSNLTEKNDEFLARLNLSHLKNLTALHFTPCHFPCKISQLSIKTNLGQLESSDINRTYVSNNVDVFMHSNPCYTIRDYGLSQYDWIEISGAYEKIPQEEYERYWLMREQQLLDQFLCVTTSASWKITKPLRIVKQKLKAALKRSRLAGLLVKGLRYLLKNGMKATLIKTKRWFCRVMAKDIENQKISEICVLSPFERKRQMAVQFPKNILFSIVVPLYNTPERFLQELFDSVQAQTYGNWELCLANGSDSGDVSAFCEKMSQSDSRIKYKKLNENMGIAGNTIAAYEMSVGKYIILLDHDDILAPNALFELASCIEEHSEADFIYSDKAVYSDANGRILAFHYLPDFSPEFLRACNYTSHLNAFSRYIIDIVGFERLGYDGSQDYEFELRVAEKAREICHINKVLYFCRATEGSVALDPRSKMYAYEAGLRAIEEHIQRIGYPGQVEFLPDTFSYRIKYDIVTPGKVSIIIPNCDHIEMLQKCVMSIIEKTVYPDYEIIIVENNSASQATFDYYQSLEANIPQVKVLTYHNESHEFNFSALNNYAVKYASGAYLLFLNNDIEVINSGWLTEMLMFAQRDDVGAVGAKLYYPNDTYQHLGLYIGLGGHIAAHYEQHRPKNDTGYMHHLTMPQNYSAVTAACMMVKKTDFENVGGFDDITFKVGLNDVDFCLKLLELGKFNVVTPYAELYHYESVSRGSDEHGAKKERLEREQQAFRTKWEKYFKVPDRFYNSGLDKYIFRR